MSSNQKQLARIHLALAGLLSSCGGACLFGASYREGWTTGMILGGLQWAGFLIVYLYCHHQFLVARRQGLTEESNVSPE